MQKNLSSAFLSKLVGVNREQKIKRSKVYEKCTPKISLDFIDDVILKLERLPDAYNYPAYYFFWLWCTKQNYYDTHVRGKGHFDSSVLDKYQKYKTTVEWLVQSVCMYLQISGRATMDPKKYKSCLIAIKYCYKLKKEAVAKIVEDKLTEEEKNFLLI